MSAQSEVVPERRNAHIVGRLAESQHGVRTRTGNQQNTMIRRAKSTSEHDTKLTINIGPHERPDQTREGEIMFIRHYVY
jgi:hypothetical protein